MTTHALLKQELFDILKTRSFRRGQFRLASGALSDYYLDCRMSTLDGRGAYLIGCLLHELLEPLHLDAVGGMTLGADPMVASVIYRSAEVGRHPLAGFIVRKNAKGHGMGRRIEGHLSPWMRVALLEDVVTSGSSTVQAVEAIREAYPTVKIEKIVALVDRDGGGREAFTRLGIPFEALYNVRAFLTE